MLTLQNWDNASESRDLTHGLCDREQGREREREREEREREEGWGEEYFHF